jgi:uncharacterized protein YggE
MDSETRHTLVAATAPIRYAAAAALGILALFLLVKTFDALALYGQGQNPQINTITVTGEGKSTATPDIAKLSFTVQEQATDVKSAQDAAAKKANDAIASLSGFGIADKDVKTTDYTVQPQYASQPAVPCYAGQICSHAMVQSNKITGYQVTQSVEVTVRDTAKVGDVLTKLGALGVQNISGPNFSVDDDQGVMSDARANAIKNAHDKAKELAKELGVSLGEVVSYSDQSGPIPYTYAKGGMAMDSAVQSPNLPVGQDERTVVVSVTYRIK